MSGADQTGMAVQERRKTRHLKFILVTEPNIFEHAFREEKNFCNCVRIMARFASFAIC